jgi:hypothetical protein
VFDLVVELALEHGIRAVRIPNEPEAGLSPRGLQLRALNALGRRARRRISAPDRTVGVRDAGHLTPAALRRVLNQVEGVTELVCHPGLGGAELAREYVWGYGWDEETEALRDPARPGILLEKGISLTSFRESFA